MTSMRFDGTEIVLIGLAVEDKHFGDGADGVGRGPSCCWRLHCVVVVVEEIYINEEQQSCSCCYSSLELVPV